MENVQSDTCHQPIEGQQVKSFCKRGFEMRDLKTYLSVAPVVSTLWFGALVGLLIEINRFFPDALIFPFFSF